MKQKHHDTPQDRSNRRKVTTWISVALVSLLALTYVSALALAWFRPEDKDAINTIQLLFSILTPMLTLLLAYYFGSDQKRGSGS